MDIPPTELTPGCALGGYELSMRVAAGAMGEVWAARLKGTRGFERLVAIKTLRPELSNDPNFEQLFLDEAALASRLKHPNVVEVVELGEEGSTLFQVLEWVDGDSLWSLMRAAARGGGMPLPVAGRIVHQLCAGVHAAHELTDDRGIRVGLVHRDLSPTNVLIATNGVTKVSDFGVARFRGRGAARTQVGELRGSVPYMSPEHVLGDDVDRRADVFALGVVLYQLATGVHPFLADDDRLTLTNIASEEPARLVREHLRDAPQELQRTLVTALAKRPAGRTASAADLMAGIARSIPGAAMRSSDASVARYLDEMLGARIRKRSAAIQVAFRDLDSRPPHSQRRSSVRPAPSHPAAAIEASQPGGVSSSPARSRTSIDEPPAPVDAPASTPRAAWRPVEDDPTTQVLPPTGLGAWSPTLRFGAGVGAVLGVAMLTAFSLRTGSPSEGDGRVEAEPAAPAAEAQAAITPVAAMPTHVPPPIASEARPVESSPRDHPKRGAARRKPPPPPAPPPAIEASQPGGVSSSPARSRTSIAAPPPPPPPADAAPARPRPAKLPPDEFAPGGI